MEASSMDPNNQQPAQYNTPPPVQPEVPGEAYGSLPQTSSPQSSSPEPLTPKKNRLPFIIAGVLVGLLLILTLIGVFASKSKTPTTIKPAASTSDSGSNALLPATAIGIEQASNSISQDLSGINDDNDFPPNKLDDRSLGL